MHQWPQNIEKILNKSKSGCKDNPTIYTYLDDFCNCLIYIYINNIIVCLQLFEPFLYLSLHQSI